MEHAPSRVLLSFNERVETVFNSIEVLNQKRERVDSGVPQVAGEGDVLAIGVKSLNAGQYVVFWRVVSLERIAQHYILPSIRITGTFLTPRLNQ
jgi:methionine-rich copper-binding protein CopC